MIPYLFFIALFGTVGLSAEFAIGYAVIVGWILRFLTGSVSGVLFQKDPVDYFQQTASHFGNLPFHIMGTLIPDWSKLLEVNTWVMAMGQAFFSLSITGSGMIVYGTYLNKEENIPKISIQTAIFDTIAALLAAFAIMPAVFSFQVEPNAGPPLLFITLPNIFKQMPFGKLFAIIFFLSVAFAGITSLINMFEAVIESWQHKFKLSRTASVLLCSSITILVGIFLEAEPKVGSWMDFITIIIIPFGAVLGAISIYYILGFDEIKKELETGRKKPLGKYFAPIAKYIYVPLAVIVFILGIIYGGIG